MREFGNTLPGIKKVLFSCLMRFTSAQLEKLSDLCIDIAKGLFLAALVVPAISSLITLLVSLRILCTGLFFTYLSLKIIEIKEAR